MELDNWGDPIKEPIRLDLPENAVQQRRSFSAELTEMQQRLLKAMTQSFEDSKKSQAVAQQIHPLTRGRTGTSFTYDARTDNMQWKPGEPVKLEQTNPLKVQQAEEVSANDMEKLIYKLRDEWCAEKGEWDGTKMPVNVLAEKIMKSVRAYKRPGWNQ